MATVQQSIVVMVIRAGQIKCVCVRERETSSAAVGHLVILLCLICLTCHLQISHHASRGHAHSSGTVSAILVSVLLVCVLAALGYYVFKHKTDAFRFHYFKVRYAHTHKQPSHQNGAASGSLCAPVFSSITFLRNELINIRLPIPPHIKLYFSYLPDYLDILVTDGVTVLAVRLKGT